jgi:phage replication O-like protein O
MADVQPENGFTRIANQILENIIKLSLNGTQFRIIMLVWRETYGFNRKEHSLSETFIASRLGLQRQNIHREVKGLFDSKILVIVHEATFNSSRVIAFNKNYDEWQNGLLESKQITGIRLDSSTGIENDSSTGIGLDSHRKKPLKTLLKKDMPKAKVLDSPTAIELILNDKTLYPISEERVKEWSSLYPAVNIMQELRKMKGWLDANPVKRKTQRGILRFVNSWLAREQDKGLKQPSQGKELPYLC